MTTKHKTLTGARIILPRARLGFNHLLQPDTGGQYSDDKFKATLLFDVSNPDVISGLKVAKAACKDLAMKAFGTADVEFPFKDGAEKAEKYAAYRGCWFCTAKSKYRPQVVGTEKVGDKLVELTQFSDVYAGMYVRVSVVPFSYLAGQNKGISLRLCNVQKVAEGEPFGGSRVAAEADFAGAAEAKEVEENTPF